jgi:hypothetical protein
MILKIINKIFLVFFIGFILLFVFDIFTSFKIKYQAVKNVIYIGTIVLTVFNGVKYFIKNRYNRNGYTIFLFLVILCIEIFGCILFLYDTWKTQTILS